MRNSVLILSVLAVSTIAANAKERQKPNIVIIYADDMGYGDMSCQNPDSKIITPNLDKLANQGIRFTDGHSSSAVSSPSRYALLTGNYNWRRMTNVVGGFGDCEVYEDEMTMAKMLKDNGYYTAMVGKWHLGWDWSSVLTDKAAATFDKTKKNPNLKVEDFDWSKLFLGGPTDRGGFDYYYGDGTINFPPYCWIENQRVVEAPSFSVAELDFKPLEGGGKFRPGPAARNWDPNEVLPTIANKSIEIIKAQDKDEPFFLYCALNAPHAPIIPNTEFHGKSKAGYFGDFVVQCDDIVGRIVAALEEKGIAENTIIIFSADNGAENYAYERMQRFDHNSTESLQGVKRDTWEGGHRIPFIVRWDGVVKGGQVSDEVVSQVDFMQTFASILDYNLPNDAAVDSYSLLPILEGRKSKKPIREATVFQAPNNTFAIRKGDYVMIESHTGTTFINSEGFLKDKEWYNEKYGYKEYTKDEKSTLLFNLKKDRLEKNDLSEKKPEIVAELQRLLDNYRDSGRSIDIRQ